MCININSRVHITVAKQYKGDILGVKISFVVYTCILNIEVNIDVLKNHLGIIYKKLFLPNAYHFLKSVICFKKLFYFEFDIDLNQNS